MTNHRIKGADGTDLHVEETGNATGRPVIFLHGVSQCRLAWTRQLGSDLGNDLRLVAPDLRGHGLSERPHAAYGEPFLWADDLDAVISELGLQSPILCGWSWAGVVIGDYLRCARRPGPGRRRPGGRGVANGRTGRAVHGTRLPGLPAGPVSSDVEDSTTALQRFVRLCTRTEPEPQDFYATLGYNSVVPPHVRQDMLTRTVDYDDLFVGLNLPVLITHGLDDRIVLPAMSRHLAGLIPHARTSYYAGVGHTPFREDPQRFNAELRTFAASL